MRKEERGQKKSLRNGGPPQKRLKLYHSQAPETSQPIPYTEPHLAPKSDQSEVLPKPKSILKRTKKADPPPSKDLRHRSVTPPPELSKATRAKLAEEDEEIAALEKKLGLKGKKGLPQSFKDDGLDELLEGLGGEEEGEDTDRQQRKKRKADGDEWLDRKRREALEARNQDIGIDEDSGDASDDGEASTSADDEGSEMSLDGMEFPDGDSEQFHMKDNENLDTGDDFDGFDLDGADSSEGEERGEGGVVEEERTSEIAPRIRENPYVAPAVNGQEAPRKYIPPSLRKPSSSESEALGRLRRQIQGQVNRLTEANLISILGEIERIYRDNARQHVTSTLVDLLLTSVCEPTSLPDTLIILPAGFISAVYKIIGTDFGAQVIQRIVELFDEHYEQASAVGNDGPAAATSDSSKETSNLVMLLSEMYNFQVVGSNLIFDYIRLFLGKLSELNAELLLKVIRTSGPQLRQDDPSALKDIVSMLGPAVAGIGEQNISVRTKFMIETITALKNNRMRTGGVASAVTSEHTIRMKKILGTLNSRPIKGSEPLRISLKDIKDSDKKGKWWLVGASWSGAAEDKKDSSIDGPVDDSLMQVEDTDTSNLAQLAREQGMNTGVRVAIFTAIMSSSDYQDAYLRLTKLPLKKKQEYEIPKVLIICSGAEKSYNPYYTLIAKRLCGDPKLKKSFQFSLWDLFKQMGESDNDGDDDDEENTMDTRHTVNLAKMFGTLIADGGLSVSVLKNLNLSYLQPKTQVFMEVLFITILLQSQRQSASRRDEQTVVNLIMRAKDTPQMINGMQYFLKKIVRKTDIAGGKEEKKTVKWGCKVAGDTLKALVAIDTAKG